MGRNYVIEMKNITKTFGGVKALDCVNFKMFEGESLGLVGNNGAGKSTLIKILTGVYPPDRGEIYIRGEERQINNPIDARNIGIETIYQNLALVEEFTPPDNIFLARDKLKGPSWLGILDKKKMKNAAIEALKEIGIGEKVIKSPTKSLSGGEQQAVALAKALYWDAKIIIMDEPTAALGVEECEKVYKIIDELRKKDVSIIIISHNIEEIFRCVDRVSVLRQGQLVGTVDKKNSTKEEIVGMIMGTCQNIEA